MSVSEAVNVSRSVVCKDLKWDKKKTKKKKIYILEKISLWQGAHLIKCKKTENIRLKYSNVKSKTYDRMNVGIFVKD